MGYEAILDKDQAARLFSLGEVDVVIKGGTWKDVHDLKIVLSTDARIDQVEREFGK